MKHINYSFGTNANMLYGSHTGIFFLFRIETEFSLQIMTFYFLLCCIHYDFIDYKISGTTLQKFVLVDNELMWKGIINTIRNTLA